MAKTIHRIWYIKNNRSRKNDDKDGKAFYKLINNPAYGKSAENLKQSWCKTGKQWKTLFEIDIKRKLHSTKSIWQWFGNDHKTTLTLNKPAYVGMCILELNKVPMYGLHHDYIKNKYGSKLRLIFTDADNLMYEIETKNVYDNFSKNKEMLDFSNYSRKSKSYDPNALVVGKMKDDMGSIVIEEFVRLKPKMYLIPLWFWQI